LGLTSVARAQDRVHTIEPDKKPPKKLKPFCVGVASPFGPPLDPPSACPMCTQCNAAASPCYASNGNYFTTIVDLRITSPSGPLTIQRRYDSAIPVDGVAGVGWSATFSSRLYYATYLLTPPGTFQIRAYIVLADGTRLAFSQNADGQTFAPLNGRYDTLVKNADGTFDLTPQRSRRRLHFGTTGSLLTDTDENGNAQTYTYDGNGRLQQIQDSAGSGRYVNVYYGSDGRVSEVQDSGARAVYYTYNPDGTLHTVVDAANRTTTYSWTTTSVGQQMSGALDNWGRPTVAISYHDDARVNVLTAEGRTDTFNYGGDGPNTSTKTPSANGYRFYFAYDSNGLVTDRTRVYSADTGHSGPNIHTVYNPDGSVQQVTDEVGVSTAYTYDSLGRVATVTRDYQGPNAIRFDYSYDAAYVERVTAIIPTNPADGSLNLDWQGWKYDYYQTGSTAPGNLYHVYRVKDDGTTLETLATYAYNSKGQVTELTSATGGLTDYTYDASWNLWKVTGPANNDGGTRPVTTYGYDNLGRVTSVQDALGNSTSYQYDAVDRVMSVTLPKPTTSSSLNFTTSYLYDQYDSATALTFTQVKDPNGQLSGLFTKQGYDQWGRLVQSVDIQNHVTGYAYAADGTLTSVTDANGNVTTYEYDVLTHAVLDTRRTDGALMDSWAYNDDGTLQVFNSRDGWRRNTYDHLKRVTRRDSAAPYFNFTFVGQKLTEVDQGDGYGWTQSDIMTYDHSYRLWAASEGTRGTITKTYNLDDSVATYVVTSGPTASYTYYPDGSLNTIVWTPITGQFKYAYLLTGQYQSLTYPNGGTRTYAYDNQGRLTSLINHDPVAGNLAVYAYGYDHNYTTGLDTMLGQRTSLTATVPVQSLNNHLFKYEYDPNYQLAKVTYPNVAPLSGEVDSWTYDAIGNRLTNTVNTTTQTYTYEQVSGHQGQRLTSDGINTYGYNGNNLTGSVQSRTGTPGTFNFTWTYWGELAQINGGASANYYYDYRGRRFQKTIGGVTTTFLYDRSNLIRDVTGSTTTDYLFARGLDAPIAMSRAGEAYYFGVDALGSISVIANSAGSVQNNFLYDSWGVVRNTPTGFASPFGYTARETSDASQDYYRARYYQPSVGRFVSEDPLAGQTASAAMRVPALYVYAFNNPLRFGDPLGLEGCALPDNYNSLPCGARCLAKRNRSICQLKEIEEGAETAKELVEYGTVAAGVVVTGMTGGVVWVCAAPLVGWGLGQVADALQPSEPFTEAQVDAEQRGCNLSCATCEPTQHGCGSP
jgi:RHS repeat-associated protein